MTGFFLKILLRGRDASEHNLRHVFGHFAGVVGIAANIVLFAAKVTAGILCANVAIIADAFNNLSDAGTAIITTIGFKLSAAPPDKEHPFGHGRMEYIATLGIGGVILLAGIELVKASAGRIIAPGDSSLGVAAFVILAAAILLKLWMMSFYRKVGKIIDSTALLAASCDSRNDAVCTAAVLISSLAGRALGISIDGYIGLAVALFILWSGVAVLRRTMSTLLGQAPDRELVDSIRKTVLEKDGIIGVHDLMVHNYGPGRYIISLHAEVPCGESMMHSHDVVDRVENELNRKYNAVTCVHMDPVEKDDSRVNSLKALVIGILADIDARLTIHDFRTVPGETHTNLVFDLVVPFDYPGKKRAAELAETVQRMLWQKDETLFAVITVEHSYTP